MSGRLRGLNLAWPPIRRSGAPIIRLISVVLLLTLVAACGFDSGSSPAAPDSGAVDLLDSDALARLGVPDPEIDWERSIDRLRYVGAGRAPTEAEVGLVRQVIDDMPTALLSVLDVRWVVRASDTTSARPNHPTAVAFAVGPDIYLLDRAFSLSEGGSTRYDLARAVAHELVHVAQFRTLEDRYVSAALDGRLSQLDPVAGSALTIDFADATGWSPTSSDPLARTWSLEPGVTAASAYGATSPGEDMSESVALVVLGLADLVSPDRVRWVEQWLGAPADALAIGQPWAPAGSTEVLSAEPLYDTQTVASIRGALTHEEPLYFELPGSVESGEALASTIEDRLRARILAGSMEPIPDERVARWGGRFSRPDGTMWWVELWDFRQVAPGVSGPTNPILVYVSLW